MKNSNSMKEQILVRCLLGAPIGVAISYFISVIISLLVGDGRFYAVVPELIEDCGSEITAVLVQLVCSLLYGAVWAGASVVWSMDHWSLTRMTVTHLLLCSGATFPTAYFMRWMDRTPAGVAAYFGIFFASYLVIWLFQYFTLRAQIRRMDRKMQNG